MSEISEHRTKEQCGMFCMRHANDCAYILYTCIFGALCCSFCVQYSTFGTRIYDGAIENALARK